MLLSRRGYTLIEMILVVLLLGVIASFALPRALKSTPEREVDIAAAALARDLELVRMRAIAAKRMARVSFDAEADFYTAYMDISEDRLGLINETREEVSQSGMFPRGSRGGVPGVELPSAVEFGAGVAGVGPTGDPIDDPISLEGGEVEFDHRGMVTPAGSDGVIYLVHRSDPGAVAAVTISGAGAFRAWRYRDGRWIK